MKGPKPVWILATKRLRRSRARVVLASTCCTATAAPARSRSRRLLSGIGRGWRIRRRAQHLQRLHAGHELRRRLDLGAAKMQQHGRVLVLALKMHEAPVDGDLAAADAEESPEIDHQGPGLAVAVDDDIDHHAHVLPGLITHLAA